MVMERRRKKNENRITRSTEPCSTRNKHGTMSCHRLDFTQSRSFQQCWVKGCGVELQNSDFVGRLSKSLGRSLRNERCIMCTCGLHFRCRLCNRYASTSSRTPGVISKFAVSTHSSSLLIACATGALRPHIVSRDRPTDLLR